MNKKRAFSVLFILSILFVVSSIIAQEASVEDSYTCLEDQLEDNCGNTNNVEQAVFNLLATAYDSGLQSDCRSLLNSMKTENCWGDSDGSVCKIKPTALSILALNHIDEDVDNSLDWLLDRKIDDTGLTWFLEIDADNKTVCDVNGREITIREDKKITGADPSGLKKAYNNYWFQITNIGNNFTVSCDLDFVTALLYQKPGSSVYYVSSETQSASAYDSLTENVEAFCFGTSNKCDYEGSLWSVLALAQMDEDISSYIPYLSAMSDDSANNKYLPSSFLYLLTGSDDYYTKLVNKQKQNKYWLESNNKFYDTSVALLSIGGLSINEADDAKRYLLSVREASNCWNSHTSFILYSGWPKNPATRSIGGGSEAICESSGYFCTSIGDCDFNERLDNFQCASLSDTCCEFEPIEETCSERGGGVCSDNEVCSGSEVITSNENYCCLGICEEIEEEDYCTDIEGYTCETSCSDNQEEKSFYTCDFGDVCCADKPKSATSWWLIILLVTLIILVILAIIFRNQLKIWFFRTKSKFRSGKEPRQISGRPGMPPRPVMPIRPGGRPRQIIPRGHMPPRRRITPQRIRKDKDFDDTMKKLRDMSK